MHNSSHRPELIEDFVRTESIYDQLPRIFNLAAFLLERNAARSDKTAFYHRRRSLTYGELQRFVPLFAGMLQQQNCRREERVVILLPDSPEFALAWLGILWGGHVAVLMNEALSTDDLAWMLDDSRARIVISTREWQDKLRSFDVHARVQWIIADELWDSLPQYHATEACSTNRDEAAFWAYTSGSTGRPKGVIHAHYSAVVACVRYAVATLGLVESDRIYTSSPMAFSYGLGTSLYMPMFAGASAVLDEAASAFGYIEAIHAWRPNVFFAIPHHYATMLALQDIAPLDASSIRLAVSAAEQLSVQLWSAWEEKHHLRICEGIGTTESTHIFLSNRPDNCIPGSAGKPVEGYQIEWHEGHAADTDGQVQVTGEGMMLGYWNRLPETQAVLRGKTLITADLYHKDDENNYYFSGRRDDLLKVGGMWVATTEVEQVIAHHPGIREAAIVTTSGRLIAETSELACYLVMDSADVSADHILPSLKQTLQQRFRRCQIPRHFHVLPALPRTVTGKIDRKTLQLTRRDSPCNAR